MLTFKIQIENFQIFNLENYHLFSFFPPLSERWFGKLSHHLIALPICEASWHHLSRNTYSLGICWDRTQVLHLLQLYRLIQHVCSLPAAAEVSAGPASPWESWHAEDAASRLHMGLACRSTATSPVVQVLTSVVGAAAPPEETHCRTLLKSWMLKVSHCVCTEMNIQIS